MTPPAEFDEGVTKFELEFVPAPAVPIERLRALIAWRGILWRLGLVGRDPARYGGVGFGNLSRRLSSRDTDPPRFAITGTQTGALATLDATHFAVVTACEPTHNRVHAEGPIPPSSESLTHGMLYRIDPSIGFIFHVHSPDIWHARDALKLPTTDAHVAYGTPAMAAEMRRLKRRGVLMRRRIVVMAGHEDGVISFGRSAEQAGAALLRTLARAMTVE
jgi:ribulose-5-phosphate 4-epimerase/fuculose-1-phosphate aldolase